MGHLCRPNFGWTNQHVNQDEPQTRGKTVMTSQLTSAIRSHNNNILSIFSARKKVGSNAADERRPALCQGSVCLEILNFSWAALGLPICPIAVNYPNIKVITNQMLYPYSCTLPRCIDNNTMIPNQYLFGHRTLGLVKFQSQTSFRRK